MGLFGGNTLHTVGSVVDGLLGNPIKAARAWDDFYKSRDAQRSLLASLNLSPEEQALVSTGGQGLATVLGSRQKQKADAAEFADNMRRGDELGLSPAEKLALARNPGEWAKNVATRAGFHTVNGGDTIINGPGGAQTVAPKLVENGGVYGTQDATGYHEQGQRSANVGELETGRHNLSTEEQALNGLLESARHNKVDEGISAKNANTSAFSASDASKRGWAGLKLEGDKFALSKTGADKPPTEDQAKTGFNADRMAGASAIIGRLENSGHFNPTLVGPLGAMGATNSREYNAAKREWSDGIIRMTTGAAATKQEIDAVDQAYFPQIGDAPAVIAQKAARRISVQRAAQTRAAGQRQPSTTAVGGLADPLGIR